MKYSKIRSQVLKWLLPISILLLLVGLICYKYKNNTIEILGNCNEGEFHSKIAYNKFKSLSLTNKKEYGDAFKALQNYSKTKLGEDVDLSKKMGNRFQLSKDKSFLRWILKSGEIKMFEIDAKKNILDPSDKCKTESFTTLTENFFGSDSGDKILITPQDVSLFISNNLFNLGMTDDSYDFIANPDNCSSCYNFVYGSDTSNCRTPNRIKSLFDTLNKDKLNVHICTAEDSPLEFKEAIKTDPNSGSMFSSDIIKPAYRVAIINAINYVFNNRLKTSDTRSPYYSFEITHDNLILLSKNIIDAINEKTKNKLYCWFVKQT